MYTGRPLQDLNNAVETGLSPSLDFPQRNVLYEEQERERQHTSCLERNETLSFDLAFDLAFYDGAVKRIYPPPKK